MMTPEERAAQALSQAFVWTGHRSRQQEIIAAAIDEAVAEEREAIAVITDRWACTYGGVVGEMFGQLSEVIRARATPRGPATPPPAEAESPPLAGSPLRP